MTRAEAGLLRAVPHRYLRAGLMRGSLGCEKSGNLRVIYKRDEDIILTNLS